jgi:hypothetical protein
MAATAIAATAAATPHSSQRANPDRFRLGGANEASELSITTATSCASRLGFQARTNSDFPRMKWFRNERRSLASINCD